MSGTCSLFPPFGDSLAFLPVTLSLPFSLYDSLKKLSKGIALEISLPSLAESKERQTLQLIIIIAL